MCGRFAATTDSARLVERFGLDDVTAEAEVAEPSWNVAPSTSIRAIVARQGRKRLQLLRWGLVPSWSKSCTGGARLINARAESVDRSPAFRAALAARRAIIPMDGFYEWQRSPGGSRQPFYFCAPDGEPLAVAALWEAWRDPSGDGPWVLGAAIVTTAASAPVSQVYPRMPVVLRPAMVDEWLGMTGAGPDRALQLLATPGEGVELEARRVGAAVNRVANDSPELVEALDPGRLFDSGPAFDATR